MNFRFHEHPVVLLLVSSSVLAVAAVTQSGDAYRYCEEPMLLANNKLCVCPLKCVCYTWTKLRRVDCVHNRLANIHSNDVPLKVQVLDISDNLIAELTDGYFWGLSQIQYLYVARNALHNLEPFSLSGLRRLTVLDLSDNRLRILPPRLFDETPRLKELRLAGNHLVSVPIVQAYHLQELDVSRCQLAYLSPSAFVGVIKLTTLNVSINQFLQLPMKAMTPLRSLRYLHADGNPFNCDAEMEKLTFLLKKNNVTSSGLCEFRTTSSSPATGNPAIAFARMVALPDPGPGRSRSYNREHEPDYPYDWEREEPIIPFQVPRVPIMPVSSRPELADVDRCGAGAGAAVTKPERFFKFGYSDLFAVIIGFKIGFVTAILMLRGCNGQAPSQQAPLPPDHATRVRLLGHTNAREANPSGSEPHCDSEERPETPPPAYHELGFHR